MPSLCPVCGRAMCDHTAVKRGQSYEEMMRPLTPDEEEAWCREPTGAEGLIDLARRNAHLPTK
ncbi:MAG: hypothetical protein UX68_C0017G0009 [Parcubacteria group bacterium GW2011_GWA2_46_9]|nr:MAG: hypothetical protein UX68_C0017G0009 [Parcubacteria group bacterium GW2011_GWA2_46_9]